MKAITFLLLPVLLLVIGKPLRAQTDMDGLMMEKNAFCVGPMYSYSSWTEYWEGTRKRENLNLGRVSTRSWSVMGNYGVTRNINLLFNVPYVKTKASAGTLAGQEGMQDLSLFVKWRAFTRNWGAGRFSLIGVGGVSNPISNYTPDFLPLSIGLRSTTLSARIMADYQIDSWFATGSATYVARSNIRIDRDAYYTTELHNTNKVEMPDALNLHFRAGWRNQLLVAEAVLNNWTTLGGFDITRNNMPFPSNRMNALTAGINVKYVMPFHPNLSLVTGGNTTLAGRNVGKATGVYGSFFYVFDLSRKQKANKTANP
ncbi:MAG: hypothetical protein ACK4E0_00055 [Chitinophagaceae bacterium]